jgi:hypothetical protein
MLEASRRNGAEPFNEPARSRVSMRWQSELRTRGSCSSATAMRGASSRRRPWDAVGGMMRVPSVTVTASDPHGLCRSPEPPLEVNRLIQDQGSAEARAPVTEPGQGLPAAGPSATELATSTRARYGRLGRGVPAKR